MDIKLLEEPLLQFGKGEYICPRTGIYKYNVSDINDIRPDKIVIGFIGLSESINIAISWIKKCRNHIESKKSKQPNLFTNFPGFNETIAFRSEVVYDESYIRKINNSALDQIKREANDIDQLIIKTVDLYLAEIHFLANNKKPDVILCVLDESLTKIIYGTKTIEIDDDFNEFVSVYKNNVAIYFKDINNDYVLEYNSNKIFYSASTSKVFMVIYLLEQYRNNNLDLETKLVYKPSDAMQGSIGMKKHKYYDEVQISELISHMLEYSDNTAYFMLIKYVGLDTLKEYFKEYNLVMESYDPFIRNYSASLANKSLERLYNLLLVDDIYSKLIKDAMNNRNMNYLRFDDKVIYHKYGYYDVSYHDIGMYLDTDYPYFISVLTLYGNGNYSEVVNNISKKVYEIYAKNLKLKEEHCKSLIEE